MWNKRARERIECYHWWRKHLCWKVSRKYLVRMNFFQWNALLRLSDGHPESIELFFSLLLLLFVIIHPSVIEEGNKWPYSSLHLKRASAKERTRSNIDWFLSLYWCRERLHLPLQNDFSFSWVFTAFSLSLVQYMNSRTFPAWRLLFLLSNYLCMHISREREKQIADNGLIWSTRRMRQLIEKSNDMNKNWSITHEWHNWIFHLFDWTIIYLAKGISNINCQKRTNRMKIPSINWSTSRIVIVMIYFENENFVRSLQANSKYFFSILLSTVFEINQSKVQSAMISFELFSWEDLSDSSSASQYQHRHVYIYIYIQTSIRSHYHLITCIYWRNTLRHVTIHIHLISFFCSSSSCKKH